MFAQIITHTPIWVWILLAALVALGLSQTRDRKVSVKRVTILPLVMIAFSASSVLQSANGNPSLLLAWLAACIAVARIVMHIPLHQETHYQVDTGLLMVKGTWVPMALILTIFIGKYATTIVASIQTELAQSVTFTMTCAFAFGALSGVFLGRAARLWKLVSSSKSVRAVQTV